MRTKRIFAALVLITFFITTYGINIANAAISDVPVPSAPNRLAITPLNGNEPPIGYNAADGGESGYYADIGWEAFASPFSKYLNIYLEESPKGYRPAKPLYQKEKDLPADTTPIRMRNLSSGTIYKANAKAYATAADPVTGTIYKSSESMNSNTLKFMTDINIQCVTTGTNKIKIIWDDVWNEGKRINYKLYVSENKDFANTLPINITQTEITQTGPVFVNQADGTLEYEHTVKDPGRVYYVKIVPDISDPQVIKSPETQTILVSTYILVKTSKMSTTDVGTIWRLDWSPVVTGISSSNIKVQYIIDKYVNNMPNPIMKESGTTTFITVPEGEKESFYIIRAEVTKDGLPYYPNNISIVSDKIVLKESEVPSTPPMPEIVPQFTDSTNAVIISYEDVKDADGKIIKKGELGSDTATVLWRLPRRADGSVDEDVLYDIWLIEDPDQIDAPPVETRVQSAFKPGEQNYVRDNADNGKVIGYKYKLEGLDPNHTYYFKIVAKKVFAEDVDGIIQSVEHISNPALKVIITLPGGAIDTPLIPSNPPLQIRKQEDGLKDMITDTGITIQLKNRWYEKYDPDTGKWSYVQADRESLSDVPPYDPVANQPDDMNYRKVEYGPGVSLYVGCTEYTEGIDISAINTYKLEKVSPAANDDLEDPTLNAPENIPTTESPAIYAKHNVVIPVNELKPNTTYILWIRAVRDGDPALFSDVSNPIIFTTLPTPVDTVEKPVVPDLRCTNIADTFVDLAWEYKEQNTYYIKYGTSDDISKAQGSLTVTGSQIKSSGVDYVRVPGLKADTQYFFWIQAEAFSTDMSTSQKSEWSDSLPLRTLKDIPPSTPRGFGVKNTADAVTKNSITFEWIKEDGLEYILEIASSVDYKDVKVYEVGSVSEFKVDGLTSNFRYYARLYAYDPVKELKSLPTPSISVRTLRSSDDYDSDQDIDHPISGDMIDKAPTAVNGTWVVKIVGVNADRLVQLMMTDNVLDYTVDVSKPPSATTNISLMISKKVFDKLAQLRENIAFKTTVVTYGLKAGILSNINTADTQKEQIYIFSIVLTPQKPAAHANELILRQPLSQMGVTLDTGASNMTVSRFAVPLVVSYPYTNQKDYVEGQTNGYLYNSVLSSWEQQATSNRFDVDNSKGAVSFQSSVPGLFALADRTSNLFDDIYGHMYESSIINVAMAHKLNSITGRIFNPDKNVTSGEAVKLVFDSLSYNYGSDYMELAVKTGLVKSGRTSASALTRQDAACMAAVLYEIKTNSRVNGSKDVISTYSDYSKVDKTILSKVAFAVENGFVPNSSSTKLNPTQNITRGELMYMIEKALVLAGDIQ
jgi:hypothetical protein